MASVWEHSRVPRSLLCQGAADKPSERSTAHLSPPGSLLRCHGKLCIFQTQLNSSGSNEGAVVGPLDDSIFSPAPLCAAGGRGTEQDPAGRTHGSSCGCRAALLPAHITAVITDPCPPQSREGSSVQVMQWHPQGSLLPAELPAPRCKSAGPVTPQPLAESPPPGSPILNCYGMLYTPAAAVGPPVGTAEKGHR